MSATDELRRMLDERGVEWRDGDASYTTEWTNANGQKCSAMYWKPTFSVLISDCTPEQAIAATLGSDREAELQKALDFMRIWISEDAHLGESAISYKFERAEGLRRLAAIEGAIDAWNTRAERTCRIVKSEFRGGMWVYCHEFSCGCGQRNLFTTSDKPPRYCPNCGAKVASE